MPVVFLYASIGTAVVLLVLAGVGIVVLQRRIWEMRQTIIGLSQQIRTPLLTLKKNNTLMRDLAGDRVSQAEREAFDMMERATQETVVVMNRLIAVAKLEERAQIVETIVDLRSSIRSVVNELSEIIDAHKLSVQLQLGTRPVRISVDPLVLHGIFNELLMNAILYTPPGGTISVATKSDWRQTIVTISDSGIGISDDERPRIFHQFFRGERAKKMAAGTGLGLSFAQKFARLIGGSVSYVPHAGRGSTFRVVLPQAMDE